MRMIASKVMLVAAVSLCALAEARPVEIKARNWINTRSWSLRIPEDRETILFFFTTAQQRKTERFIRKLNRANNREDTLVIGLTPQSQKQTAEFLEKTGVRFMVGTGAKPYRDFRVRKFPTIIVFSPSGSERQRSVGEADIESWLDQFAPSDPQTGVETVAVDETSPTEILKEQAAFANDKYAAMRALRLLAGRLETKAFLDLCDELSAATSHHDFTRRGAIQYERQLADPAVVDKEPPDALSSQARRSFRAAPDDDPQWDRLRAYDPTGKPADTLMADFNAHLTDDPTDLLIRRWIADEMSKVDGTPEVIDQLVEMLRLEPDFANRTHLVLAFSNVAGPGDLETADVLEGYLSEETNVRVVRPSIGWIIDYLRNDRNGEEEE